MSAEAILDAPVRRLFERLEPLAAAPAPDLNAIGRLLAGLAEDHEYMAHHIAVLGGRSGARALVAPETGPRLMLVHRREGEMGAVHSHRVWVALAPTSGVETHRRYRVQRANGQARVEVAEERHLEPGESATLLPPDDIHAHGHARGVGEAAYVLILAGDNQVRFEREQYDPATGAVRVLPPGDPGDWLA